MKENFGQLSRLVEDGAAPQGNRSHAVSEEIKHGLMTGVFRPGDKLTIRDLAANLGVSPTPVREALVQLAAEGALAQVAGRSFVVPELTAESYQDLRRLRVLIEGEGAGRAAENATKALIDRLAHVHEELIAAKAAENYKAAMVWNQRFHLELCAAANSPRLLRIVEGLWLQMGPILNILYERHDVPATPVRHCHLTVIDALVARDAERARAAIQEDISGSAPAILNNLDYQHTEQSRGRK
ncbi:probable GntR-family transcriptional regulator [Pseudooceanicola batsensis HTCC2597]|uniref:Probable GntR-family transcriptional regulator n=1 Tax=Pseudooceanicola batsensis (strain ATCC BAA-863 / DSM 15984 / KCTC 12145 / HTCC2597) TaxID=252305 RepID=A3U1C7_PSEBH|nr:GntR family transcriptional regulator [Pseudooceanicola batsensis]EAQ02110.1 probable GntR-family transcriptional regulator [Pseudooceanicola batsensis HTCC2597]